MLRCLVSWRVRCVRWVGLLSSDDLELQGSDFRSLVAVTPPCSKQHDGALVGLVH